MIVHNELGHEEREGIDAYGEERRLCTLYPGMSCREHVDAAVDVDNAREDELIRVPFIELCPNSWFVLPTGDVQAIAEEEQFVPGKVQAHGARLQKELGTALDRAAFERLSAALRRGDEALDEERHAEALAAWAGCQQTVREPHAALKSLIATRKAAVDEAVTFEFEDLSEPGPRDQRPLGERLEAVRALVEQVQLPIYGEHLPVRGRMLKWLAEREGRTSSESRK